ncbi:MAG: outer membrane lipid asymmetry maintenance protein MlaD [Pseudomonadota bacterium]|nr:outer membrane lipid asymmetry maintenance protein MlaD [Pseudomonadota bacterium]
MLREKNSELSVGLFILIAFFALLFVTIQTTSLNFKANSNSYKLNASFTDINGLRAKAPVRIAGVKIGEVTQIKLNSKTYQADIGLVIYNEKVKIPKDSIISILTEGVVGSKFISIDPGYDEEYLKNGQSIDKSKPSLAIEQVINEAIAIFATKEGS